MKNKLKAIDEIQLKTHGALASDAVFLAVLSGLLLFLSFPKYGSGWFAWIAFVPLFFALRKAASITQGLLLGFITGIVSYIGIIYWIASVVINYGYLPLYLGIILMLLLACYLSVYVALFAGGIVYFREKIALSLVAPVLWVCFEYCKSIMLTGFPWENLGYSQYLNTYLIQFADIAGVFGLSFLIVIVNAAIFEVISKRSKRAYTLAAVVFLILAVVYIYGFYRLDQVNKLTQNAPGMEVSLIQGNIDQSIKWNENYQRETLNIYEQLSLKNAQANGSLIVWPETAAPFSFQDMNNLHDQVVNLSVKTKSWLIFGSISYLQKKGSDDYFNSAYLLSPSGEIKDKYDKVHLVPYGEYVPLRNVFPFIKKLTAGMGDFGTGTGYYPLSLGDKKVGVLICYEAILPFAARMYKKRSAELLVNITNDAWFGATSAPFQHFSMTVFRAVETRLYLVRAANTGISGIIDPGGKIIAKTNIFHEDALKGYIKFVKIPAFYADYGDLLVIVCFVLIIFCFLGSLKGRIKNANRKYQYTRNSK
jgi:apolipoprotein N-acyltransferase